MGAKKKGAKVETKVEAVEAPKDHTKDHEVLKESLTDYMSKFDNNGDPQVRLAIMQNILNLGVLVTKIGVNVAAPQIGYFDVEEMEKQKAKAESPIITP